MLTLEAKIRQKFGRKTQKLRNEGIIPAVLYGPKTENQAIEVDLKEFEKVFEQAGESSLISLQVDRTKKLVLIHKVKRNPLSGEIIHIDFYQPILTEEVEATVPLIFEGESPAVKDLGGTLIKEIQELTVKALPQNLPHEIKVNVKGLKSFDDEILIKNLELPKDIKIKREPDEIVALVAAPAKVEEELEEPIEEKVEKVEGEKKEEEKKEPEEKSKQ
jgi:large subunit ribosomal protein L25